MTDTFSRKGLDIHNQHRTQHNVPPLTWSNELARDAQKWAKDIAKKNKLMHAKDRKGVGENIFMSSRADFDDAGADATESWYSEVKNYDFSKGGYQPNTGHFTQVVWKSSAELGMARAKAKNGSVYVVARYKPAGNMMKDYDDNVLPKVSSGESSPETNNQKNIDREKKKEEKEEIKESESKPAVQGKEEMAPVHVIMMKPASFVMNDQMIAQVLDAHNQYRTLHSAVPLKWSLSLSKAAQAWAEKLAREGKLAHASREDRYFKGENVCRMSSHFNLEDAIKIWYSEKGNYDYDQPRFDLSTGHFTQIVWRGSREVGVGMAKSPDGKLTYLVARYNPPGNILNRFEDNVLPE